MAMHSSVLAWRIPWTEEPCGLQAMGSQRVRHCWATYTFTFSHSLTVRLLRSPHHKIFILIVHAAVKLFPQKYFYTSHNSLGEDSLGIFRSKDINFFKTIIHFVKLISNRIMLNHPFNRMWISILKCFISWKKVKTPFLYFHCFD